jgi:hypothetical protein
MPKQSDDLTQEGDKPQETEKGLKIPIPTRDQIKSAFRKVAGGVYPVEEPQVDEAPPPAQPAP